MFKRFEDVVGKAVLGHITEEELVRVSRITDEAMRRLSKLMSKQGKS